MATEFNDATDYAFFIRNSHTLTSGNGYAVRWSEMVLAALRAAGVLDLMEDGTTAPAIDKLWLDKNSDPAVLKEWDSVSSTWQAMTFDRLFGRAIVTDLVNVGGTANAITADEPSPFIDGRLYGLIPLAGNTGATTVQIAGVGTYDVVYPNGDDIIEGELVADLRTPLLFANGRFEIIFGANAGSVKRAETDASSFGFVIDEDDMASDSDEKVPTQQSVKAFASDPANQAWTQTGTGATPRNVKVKLQDFSSEADFTSLDAILADAKTNNRVAYGSGQRIYFPIPDSPTFDMASNVLGASILFTDEGDVISGSKVTVPASKNLALFRVSRRNGGNIEIYGNNASKFVGYNFNITALPLSDTTGFSGSDVYGVIGNATNEGYGSTKAGYFRVTSDVPVGNVGASSALALGISGSVNQQFTVGVELGIDSNAAYGQSTSGAAPTHAMYAHKQFTDTVTLGWGIYFAKDIGVNNAAFVAHQHHAALTTADFARFYNAAGTAELFSVDYNGYVNVGTKANGVQIQAGTVTRTAAAGSLVVSAGSSGTLFLGAGTIYPLQIVGAVVTVDNTNGRRLNFSGAGATTVGVAGSAAALPSAPLGYVTMRVNNSDVKLPYYNT